MILKTMYNDDVMKKIPFKRTQVLLEPGQLETLSEIAAGEGKSLSALLREIIATALQQRKSKALSQAAENMIDAYYSNGDLVGYGALDGDDFQDKGLG